jgi:hypothetical protein
VIAPILGLASDFRQYPTKAIDCFIQLLNCWQFDSVNQQVPHSAQ